MSILKKISLAVAAVAIVSTSSFAGQVLAGGNVPLINNVVGLGVLTLDLASDGNDVSIATFIVNNNSGDYDITWNLTNSGNFENADGDQIAMSNIVVQVSPSNTGTLGTTGVAPALPIAAGTGTWSVTQTTATINYAVEMIADWTSAQDALAGLYTEQIEFTIVATL
jgi:hypothetical protein